MVLDGALILSASILLTIQNPGRIFGTAWPETSYSWGFGQKRSRSDMVALESVHGNTSEQFEGYKPTSP